MDGIAWADRGRLLQLDACGHAHRTCCVGVSRLGTARTSFTQSSVWLQLRGRSWVESREGRFQLRRGDWIVLAPGSRPVLQADVRGLCLGLVMEPEFQQVLGRLPDMAVLTGRGHAGIRDARMFLHLWRGARLRLQTSHGGDGEGELVVLRPLLLHLAAMQHELASRLARCPGRSRQHRRQVFGRLQRARLYLEGNSDRMVSLSELAELTSFSSWYFSKTFHGLYEESPQVAARRLRLERAAELLASGALLVGEVAAACGFDNACSFARAFRSQHGMSASNYREHARSFGVAPARTDPAKAEGVAGNVRRIAGP